MRTFVIFVLKSMQEQSGVTKFINSFYGNIPLLMCCVQAKIIDKIYLPAELRYLLF